MEADSFNEPHEDPYCHFWVLDALMSISQYVSDSYSLHPKRVNLPQSLECLPSPKS